MTTLVNVHVYRFFSVFLCSLSLLGNTSGRSSEDQRITQHSFSFLEEDKFDGLQEFLQSDPKRLAPSTFPKLADSDADLGIVNVALPPFSADPTGKTDSTKALQAAIEYGRRSNLTIYVPLGTYMVTDTLNCTEHLNGRQHPVVIVGQRSVGKTGSVLRPQFVLPDSTHGFTDSHTPKYVAHFWEDDSLPPPLERRGILDSEKIELNDPDSQVKTNVNYNQIFQGVNIVVGKGNFGAVGIRLRGAQGSCIQDVLIDLGEDGLIGVVGLSGSGGSHTGLTILGGRYGLDFRYSQPAPTITGATLINQTCSAMVYSGLQTLTAVGIRIVSNRREGTNISIGLIASTPPNHLNRMSPWLPPPSSYCAMPLTPPVWQPSVPPYSGQMSLIDVAIELNEPCGNCIAITTPRSIYMKNVYVRNAGYLLRLQTFLGGNDKIANPNPKGQWTVVREAAYTVEPPLFLKHLTNGTDLSLQYKSTIWIDDKLQNHNISDISSVDEIPPDLISHHLWDEASFPAFFSENAVSVTMLPFNAKGDGNNDDTHAIQSAIDQHDLVVLPKGYYRVSGLQFKQATRLIGVGRTISYLIPTTKGNSGSGGDLPALISTYGGEGTNVLAYMTILNWFHLTSMHTVHWRVYGKSIWRQTWTSKDSEWEFNHTRTSYVKAARTFPERPQNSTIPPVLVTGGGQFYNFDNGEFNFETPSYRHLLIVNSTHEVRMYQVDTEHCRGDANTEIRNSSNVEIFGLKSEGNFVVVWLRDVENVTLYGYGGNAVAFPMTSKYPAGHAQYTPSLFRLEKCQNVRLIHLVDYGRVEGTSPYAGQGFNPHIWSMVLNADTNTSTPPMDRPAMYLLNWINALSMQIRLKLPLCPCYLVDSYTQGLYTNTFIQPHTRLNTICFCFASFSKFALMGEGEGCFILGVCSGGSVNFNKSSSQADKLRWG